MDEHPVILTAPRLSPDALSPRQREVVALIAEGLTNAEIGRRLTVTPGTAANHVEAVLRRLGVGSRVQAAMWAVAHGLVGPVPAPAEDDIADGTAEAAF